MVTAVGVLMALGASAVVALARPSWLSALVLTLCGAAWLPANNGHLEGAVLITFDRMHGATVADLLTVAAFLLAIVTLGRWWLATRHARRSARTPAHAHTGSRLAPVQAVALAMSAQLIVAGAGVALAWVHQPV